MIQVPKTKLLGAQRAGAGSPAAAGYEPRWRLRRLLALLALVAAATALPAGSAAAADLPPTVPCEGCGPGAPGAGTGAYAYTQFVCVATPRFLIFAGVNVNTDEPVAFTATYRDLDAAGGPIGDATVVALGTLQAGQHVPSASLVWDIPHAPGAPQRVQITGVGTITGRMYVNFDKDMVCECPEAPTAITIPSAVTPPVVTLPTPGGAPPTTGATGVLPTTIVADASGQASLTPPAGASAVTLPDTGGSGPVNLTAWAAILIAIGLALLLVHARRGPDPHAE